MTILSTDIHRASQLLKEGKLVAFPTETVYGLGGNALSDASVAAIYAAKERPDFNPLIVHVSSLEQAMEYVSFNDTAKKLAAKFWPGPLTLVLPRKGDCTLSLLVSAGLDTVAIRMPAHNLARALLAETNIPVAAPSANRSGRVSATEAQHVMSELEGRIAMVLDGGACPVGIESTVVNACGDVPVILRLGSVTQAQLADVAGKVDVAAKDAKIASPGMLASHYAPSHAMRLNASNVQAGEGLLAYGKNIPTGAKLTYNLSEKSDLQEAAANLFRMLRLLDAANIERIAVMPIPDEGIGAAINDRLSRAAAPK
jgi:L-threonylcarbamoyladenylate synthase